MRGGVQGKKRRPSSAHSLLSLPWAPNPGSGLTSSIRKPSRTIPNPPDPHPCQELLHASVCMRVCLSVVSRAAWGGNVASIRLGLIFAGQCLLSVQGLQRTELQMGDSWG